MNRLGPKRYYLWALFLPALLTILGGLFTILFGIAKFDPELSMMSSALAATGSSTPVWFVITLQLAFALLLAPFFNMIFALG